MTKICLCCNGLGYFKDKGKAPNPKEFPEPCIVCHGTGKLLDNYTLKNQNQNQMPILKKKTPEKVTKTATPNFKVGDKVLLLDENSEEVTGTIISIDTKDKAAEIDCGENNYTEELAKLKRFKGEPEAEAEAPKSSKTSKGKGTSLGALFRKAEAAPEGGGGGFPAGNWEALIIEAGLKETKEKDTQAFFVIIGVNDDDVLGKKQTISYLIAKKEGDDFVEGPGMEYFKRDLTKLNVDVDSINDTDDIESALDNLAKEEPWIDVTAKPQTKKPEYTNIWIDGMKEDQSDKPETPAF